MNKTILKFGIYGLIVAVVLFLASLMLDDVFSYNKEIAGYATIILSLCLVYFGIKQYRDREQQGRIKFAQAFKVGMLITLFVAVGFAIADTLYTAVINPEFMEQYIQQLKDDGYQGELPNWSSWQMALLMFVTVVLIGTIIALVSALILKKEEA